MKTYLLILLSVFLFAQNSLTASAEVGDDPQSLEEAAKTSFPHKLVHPFVIIDGEDQTTTAPIDERRDLN
jgi:hypothetical protein